MLEHVQTLAEKDRLTVDDARWVLGEATRRLVPETELEGWWEGYEMVALAFAASETVCGRSMVEMRNGLEYMVCPEPFGEELIAASKMVLSAMVIFTHNPIGSLMLGADIMHDDIDPLIRKAVELLESVAPDLVAADTNLGDTYRLIVEFNENRPAEVKARNDRNRMGHLIQTAIRPPV